MMFPIFGKSNQKEIAKKMTSFQKNTLKTTAFFLILPFFLSAEPQDTVSVRKKTAYLASAGAIYAGTLVGLNELWYKNAPRTTFHFFDDSQQWAQMDKVGHTYSAFYLSQISAEGFKKIGFSEKKSWFLGSLTGFGLISTIEVFDGFSANYGASATDLLANGIGSALYASQQALWHEIRFQPKFSFQSSPFAALRPNTFGKTVFEQILKDYNGQTYWLSVNWSKFVKKQPFFLPKFLTLAVGYGADQQLYGSPDQNEAAGYQAVRRYLVGIDIQLTEIPTRKIWLKTLFRCLSVWRIPTPALEYSQKEFHWHWLK